MLVRSPYNYDRDQASRHSGLACTEPTRTQQQFSKECDINEIVRRFGLTGELPAGVPVPVQGDFTQVVDYQTALNMVIAADEAFATLPSSVRKRFANSPEQLLMFISDEANLDEARQLGLVNPALEPPAAPAPPPAANAAP